MTDVFLKFVNLGIAAGYLVLLLLLLRPLLKKAPKWLCPALWGIVGLRLLLPFSIESALSLVPSAETISPQIMYSSTPAIHSGIHALNSVVNPILSESLAPQAANSANPFQIILPVAAVVWAVGVAAMLCYALVSALRLRRRLSTAVLLRDNIYQSDAVSSPFVFGLIRPRIYLPFGMDEETTCHVIAHEQAHIRRRDHLIKPLGFILLSLYWFHPLLWVAYLLLCQDIELACDEQVAKHLTAMERADYSQALLSCSVKRSRVSACPLAFGEQSVNERVKQVLHYKKPAFWLIVVAVAACVVTAVCFLTMPKEEVSITAPSLSLEELPSDYTAEQARQDNCVVLQEGDVTSGQDIFAAFAQASGRGEPSFVRCAGYFTEGTPPSRYVQDIFFDGDVYTVRTLEFGKVTEKTYQYLLKLEDPAESPDALYDSCVRYVLANDNSLTWEKIFSSLISSQSYDAIDFCLVYADLIYEEDLQSGTKNLTLDDLLVLSQKGADLTWSDFEEYSCVETGSGLYIRVYEIDDRFTLSIGGAGPNSTPMYMNLAVQDATGEFIDIRTEDVNAFIQEHKDNAA